MASTLVLWLTESNPAKWQFPASKRPKKWDKWDKKNSFSQKRTGEVIDSKEKLSKNEPERTEKRSGEVAENIRVHKKRTESNRKTNRAMLLKIREGAKTSLQREIETRSRDDRTQPVSRKPRPAGRGFI